MPHCAKCKAWVTLPGDSWCIGCTASSELALEFQKTWAAPLRRIAYEAVVSATRQVKALRAVGTGWNSRNQSEAARQGVPDRAREPARQPVQSNEPGEDLRDPLKRKRTTTPKSAPKSPSVKGEKEDSFTEDSLDESEEEVESSKAPPPDSPRRPLDSGDNRKPPEPDHSPPGRRRRHSPRTTKEPSHQRARLTERPEKKREDRRQTKRRHRAGRKHQRLYRLLDDPIKVLHQKQPESFWALGESLDAQEPGQW